jgi:hypothetical protein
LVVVVVATYKKLIVIILFFSTRKLTCNLLAFVVVVQVAFAVPQYGGGGAYKYGAIKVLFWYLKVQNYLETTKKNFFLARR